MNHALSLLALAALATTHAVAQEATKDKTQLETVVVTSERRVERIQDVPNAVSSLSGDKLDVIASSGQDVRFLSGRVPSLNIESSFGRAFPRFYIRGYGNTDFRLNASQPVSVIVDDVIQENPILKGFPVFDTRAVEVVAGPQGTLFGRNTPAGVVKFDSVRPSQRQDGYASATVGTFGSMNVEGAFNLPLGGAWSARVSGLSQHRDDWVSNSTPGAPTPRTEGYDDRALRVQVLYEPSKAFSALANVHARNLNGSPRLFRANIIQRGSNELVAGFDPEVVSLNGVNTQTLSQRGANLRLKWALDGLNVYSITALEKVTPFSRGDIDGGTPAGPGFIPFQSETASRMDDHRQLSQELRLESTGPGSLKWQGGVYLFDEKYLINNQDYNPATNALRSEILTRQTNKAWAVFGSVNVDLSSALQLRGGLRYTSDKKDLATTGPANGSNGLTAKTDDGKWNWDSSLIYKLDKGTNLYARYATGFRASSIQNASAFGPQSQAAPEDVKSFELGLKTELMDRRLRISGNLFRYEVSDLQLTAVGGSTNATRLLNAAKASGQGFELNVDALIAPNFLVTFAASMNDTELKDAGLSVPPGGSLRVGTGFPTLRDPLVNGNAVINGNPLPQAPKWTAAVTARYGWNLANGDEISVYTDWAYRSKVNFFLYDAVEFTGKALTEGGLRVGYVFGDGRYEMAAFGRNITNQIRVTGAIDFNNLTGFINDPRTYGLQFKMNF